jgi:release factor glutamine methyltransferase
MTEPSIKATLLAAYQSYPQLSRLTIQNLLAHILGQERAWLHTYPEKPVNTAQTAAFNDGLQRLADDEPLAYITGERAFGSLTFTIKPGALVPRPETEELIDLVLAQVQPRKNSPLRIIDVGTGSGIIAVTLAKHLPHAAVIATDISRDALTVACINAQRHAVNVHFVQADLLAGLVGQFDVIAANLPYIDGAELQNLLVVKWDPAVALDGGTEGLALFRRLLAQMPARLSPDGLLALEIGYDQGQAVCGICAAALPDAQVTLHQDLAGIDRIVLARRNARL